MPHDSELMNEIGLVVVILRNTFSGTAGDYTRTTMAQPITASRWIANHHGRWEIPIPASRLLTTP